MDKNWKEKIMRFSATPMTLNKRTTEKSRKTHRNIDEKQEKKIPWRKKPS